ncbi:hypothetical protein RB597_004735 [Gaeumannomyces tritici]
MASPFRPADRSSFHIAIVCALKLEANAADLLFDDIYDEQQYGRATGDINTYTTGRVGKHAVVLLLLPSMGPLAAASGSANLRSSYPNIKLALLVGICGGLPKIDGHEAFLGDVVVSTSIFNYDFGRQHFDGFVPKTTIEDCLGRANKDIRGLLASLGRERDLRRLEKAATINLNRLQAAAEKERRRANYTAPPDADDRIFSSDYQHMHRRDCGYCDADVFCDAASRLSCADIGCNEQHTSSRNRASMRPVSLGPQVFMGRVASGNAVMRSGEHRDAIARRHGVIAFEMEGAGAWDEVPCIVVKGICDYADSHKSKLWQNFAAASAASVAVAILDRYELADNATAGTKAPTPPILPCRYIPLYRNKHFVGRGDKLATFQEKLFIQKECQSAAIVGLGGVGKTQLALQLVYWAKQHRPEYSIFWVPVLSGATFEQAYNEIARKLRLQDVGTDEDPKDSVRRYLSSEAAGPWLLIVDNADDADLLFGSPDMPGGLTDYLPESEDGLVLFTTRSREVAVSVAGSDVVELSEMDPQEAADYLKKLLIRKDLLRDEGESTKLLKELTYLPLAITQAAAYLNTIQVSIAEYLKLLRGTDQDAASLMSREFRDNTRHKGSRNAVATTWLVSFDQIRKSDRAAADLLSFLSCIELKAIPQSILPRFEVKEQIVHAIGTLCGYAFLTRRGDSQVFDMHSLVHLATRIWIQKEGRTATAHGKATRHLAEVFPNDDYANRSLWREYLPHIFKALQDSEGVDTKEKSKLCFWVGRCLGVDGRIKEAVKYLGKACQWRDGHFAEDHPDRLASQHELAIAYQANGQVKQAVALLEQVVAIRAKTLAEDHPSRLASQHALAIAYQADGQVRHAVALLEQVVAIEARTLAEDHPSRLASQHELASAYQADGQVKQAVALLEQVVAIRAKTLAEDHPSRLASQHVLAMAYQADGQVKQAVALLEQVVAIRAKTLAEDHPSRLASQHVLAMAYQANGQVKQAVALLEQVVAIRAKTLAEDHPSRLASQHELASAYQADGQVKQAVALLEQVVAIRAKTLAEDHPDRLASQHALANAYRNNGRIRQAVALLEQVVAIRAKTLAEDHPSRLASQHELAVAYQADGQVRQAVALLEQVVAIEARTLAEDHPSRLASQHELASAYQADRQVRQAVALLEQVVAIEARTLAEDHPSRLASQHELAIAYQADGQVRQAVALLEQVVAIEARTLAEDHPDRLASEQWLAYLLENADLG